MLYGLQHWFQRALITLENSLFPTPKSFGLTKATKLLRQRNVKILDDRISLQKK